jgi:hypothetical protein
MLRRCTCTHATLKPANPHQARQMRMFVSRRLASRDAGGCLISLLARRVQLRVCCAGPKLGD